MQNSFKGEKPGRYRMGIDVGTASFGLVCLTLKDGEPVSTAYHHNHIWNEPVEVKATGANPTKKSKRGEYRRARRLRDRRAWRLKDIVKVFQLIGIDTRKLADGDKKGKAGGYRLHLARALAVAERIDLEDLARVMFSMAKHRAYSGGFKVKAEKKGSDDDKGKVETGIKDLEERMNTAGCEYLGQYLWRRFERGETLRLGRDGLYASREMVETEFKQIWKTQAGHHAVLRGEHKGTPLKDIFWHVLFYQRPLASVAGMVGKCELEPNLPRAPRCQPAVQDFRIETQIADLRWGNSKKSAIPLADEQKNIIRGLLYSQRTVSFKTIYKTLAKAGCPGPDDKALNSDTTKRQELTGDTTTAAMKSLGLETQWQQLGVNTKVQVMNFLADMGSPEEVDRPDWHRQYLKKNMQKKYTKKSHDLPDEQRTRRFSDEMVKFIEAMKDTGKFGRLSKMKFDTGRSAYSIKALRQLTAYMKDYDDMDEYKARKEYLEDRGLATENLIALEDHLPPHKPTGNAVTDVALRQMRYVVNKAIDHMGRLPDEIHIELNRELGLGPEARQAIINGQNKNERLNKKAVEELEERGCSPSSGAILRWKLWEKQQDHICPYCGQLMEIEDIADGGKTCAEHIIPKKVTQIGRRLSHLVVSHRRCNDEKGDKSPWQVWGHDSRRWAAILNVAEILEKKKHYTKAMHLTAKDWEPETLGQADINDFTDRQFSETSWIAKAAAKWLTRICPKKRILTSKGQITAMLRHRWRLDTVIAEARFAEELPVFVKKRGEHKLRQDDAHKISYETFERYRAHWEGGTARGEQPRRTGDQIEKRIDNRHHVVDALVTALVTRSMVQRIVKNNQRQQKDRLEGRNSKNHRWYIAPPIKDVRDQALAMIRDCHITHKPDRHIDYNLFKDTAHKSVISPDTGQSVLASSKTLRSLYTDDQGRTLSGEKVKKKLQTVYDPDIKKRLITALDKDPDNPAGALAQVQDKNGNIIRRVLLCTTDHADKAWSVTHTDQQGITHRKLLKHGGNAWLEVTNDAGGKVIPHVVSNLEAVQRKDQPIPPDTVRYFKGDMVTKDGDERLYVIKQIKNNNLILLAITETGDVGKKKVKDGRATVSGDNLAKIRHYHDG